MCTRLFYLSLIVLAVSLASAPAFAGVSYSDPPDGWTYIHTGAVADSASGWDHDNGSDQWDSSEIGAGKPGGVSHLTDDGTYVRIQDPYPRNPGGDPSNRKIMLTHQLTLDGVPTTVADQILSVEGITISFRARIATTPPLDLYDGSTAWPAGGDGYGTHDGGKSGFSIHQDAGGDQIISFTLALATEQPANITSYMGGRKGLVMNALNGTSPSGSVDAQDNEGTIKNVLELADPTQWHEFWITIGPDTSGGGTHLVTIWTDGSMEPDEFHVTAGDGGDEGYSYIALGCGSTDQAGAFDADFFAYKVGVHPPLGSQKKAHSPDPEDEAMTPPTGEVTGDYYMLLQFSPGDGAITHTAYFSTNFDDVDTRNSAVSLGSPPYPDMPGFETAYYVGLDDENVPEHARTPLERGVTYYWVVDESNDTSTYPGDVWSFTVASEKAWDPTPADDEENVIPDPDVDLSWQMGDVDTDDHLISYDVYWGTDEAAVAADETPDAHVTAATHTIGPLLGDQDYYWRVDTKLTDDGPPFGSRIVEGTVWHFKTLFSVDEVDPHLIAWWKLDGGFGDLAFDHSGHANHGTIIGDAQFVPGHTDNAIELDGSTQYVNVPNSTGLNLTKDLTLAAWIYLNDVTDNYGIITKCEGTSNKQYVFTTVDDELRLEYEVSGNNYNLTGGTLTPGQWQHVAMTIDSALLVNLYIDGASVVSETAPGEVLAQSNPVAIGRWSGSYNNNYFNGLIDDARVYDYELSATEIKILADRLGASNPDPANGATDVSRTPTLSWTPGAFPADTGGNRLYYGEDISAVLARTADNVFLDNPPYTPLGTLDLGANFYWAVDTVNGIEIWPGDLWSFTAIGWISVDDMESYTPWTTPGNNIFEIWLDGFGDCAGSGNGTGAVLTENADPIFGGVQSMKYDFDNDGTVYSPCDSAQVGGRLKYSKAELQIDDLASGIGTNWTIQGVKALSLRFYGNPLNIVEPMWVQLRDSTKGYGAKVTYGDYADEDPIAITEESWHEWFIDMADFDVDANNLVSVTIGFGNENGTGLNGNGAVYFDDFRLYTPKCFPSRHTAEMAKADFAPLGAPDCRVDYKELDVMADDWLLGDALVTAAARPTPDPNLVAWWKFDDGSGATAINSSGTASALTLSGAITWEDGISGGAVHFRGVGSGTGTLGYNANAITVCAWVNHDVFVSGQVERYITVGSEVAVIRKENDGRLHFYIMTGGSLRHLWVSDVLTEDQWHYVVGAWDGLTQRLYIDGVLKVWQRPGGVLGTASSLNVSSSGEPFNGMLDDVRIYDYALTHGEVLSLAGVDTLYVPVPSSAEIYEGEAEGSRVVNFKDYAELMDSWLVEIKYPQ